MGDRTLQLNRIASLLGALAVIFVTALHAMQLRSTLIHEEREALRVSARVMALSLNRGMMVAQELLEQLDPLVSALPGDRIRSLEDLMRAELRDEPLVQELAIIDDSGRIVVSSEPAHQGMDLSRLRLSAETFANYSGTRIAGPFEGLMPDSAATAGQGQASSEGKQLVVWRVMAQHPHLRALAFISSKRIANELADLSSVHTRGYGVYTDQGTEVVCSEEGVKRTNATTSPEHPDLPALLRAPGSESMADAGSDTDGWLTHVAHSREFPLRVQTRGSYAQLHARWLTALRGPLILLAMMLGGLLFYNRLGERNARIQRQIRDQQAASEKQLASIVENAAEGIITFGMDGVVRRYNKAAETIMGVHADQAIGQQLGDLFPPEEVEKYRHLFWQYVEHFEEVPEVVRRSAQIKRLDGRLVELDYSASRHVEDGERLVTAIVRDVTSVREAQDRFTAIFKQSAEPQLLVTLPERKFIDANEAAAVLLEAGTRENLIGRTVLEFIPTVKAADGLDLSPDLIQSAQVDIEAHPERKFLRKKARIQTLSGSPLIIEGSASQVRIGGQNIRLLTLRDLTESERHETALREARDAAEAAALAKARFLAVMSHELRTPMSGIIGMIDMLGETRMDVEQTRFLGVLRNSSHALLTVLNDVLDYSKLEAGRVDLELLDFDLDALVASVTAVHRASALQRNTTLTVDWSGEPARVLRGDPTRLSQVLHNLIGNAVKFTTNGTVVLKLQTTQTHDAQINLAVQVRDSGVGMKPEVVESLFKPFSQGDVSTTRRFGGTGLGLAICRQLIIAMGGHIEVESAPGRGSTFKFDVPLSRGIGLPAPQNNPHAPPVVPISRRSLKLLAAEDNPTNRMLLELRLRKMGHRIDLVEDGEQAVEAARFDHYDAILMDIHMPVLDGAAATRAIRALSEPNASVPIIGLSADALPEMREQHMTSGLTAYLTKPIDWTALARLIEASVPPERGTPIEASSDATADLAPPPTAADERVDAAQVEAVRNEFGPDNWELIANVFWPRADTDLLACAQATDRSDQAARRMAAHSLKGAATTLGFHSLAQAAAKLEHCEEAGAAEALDAVQAQFAATAADWRSEAELVL